MTPAALTRITRRRCDQAEARYRRARDMRDAWRTSEADGHEYGCSSDTADHRARVADTWDDKTDAASVTREHCYAQHTEVAR